jgi:hypothetical protein
MSTAKHLGFSILIALIALCAVAIGGKLLLPGVTGITSPADARVGRPLTPVSVAGVARRTTRRCAAGVYYC